MRVLHAAADIAAQASVLASALRDQKIDAESWAYNIEYTSFPTDRRLPYDSAPLAKRFLGYLKTTIEAWGRFDLIHIHFGRSLFPPSNIDLPFHAWRRTPLVFHFHGCDVRKRVMMLERHERAACTECDPFCSPARQDQVVSQARKYGKATFVSTPDLLESVPGAEHLPVALDMSRWAPAPKETRAAGKKVVVLHAPTNRLIKGTRHVESAVRTAQTQDSRIEFQLVEKTPWEELRQRMLAADMIVDQMFLGWYGQVAVEAMALGKPVLGYLRPDFEPRTGSLPLVRVSSNEELTRRVLELAGDPERRRRLGHEGRRYVEEVHAAPVIAKRLIDTYRRILSAGSDR